MHFLRRFKRGELRLALPSGFVYDAQDQVVLDPDQQVQQSIRFLFHARPTAADQLTGWAW